MKELIFSIGIMGAGKSTYMRAKSPVVATDEIRKELFGDVDNIAQEKLIFDTAIERIVNLFKTHNTVYLDATMVETKHRTPFLQSIKNLVSDVELLGIIFQVDPEVAKRRIQKDIDKEVDRASSVQFVDEYHEFFMETMQLIKEGKVLFQSIVHSS